MSAKKCVKFTKAVGKELETMPRVTMLLLLESIEQELDKNFVYDIPFSGCGEVGLFLKAVFCNSYEVCENVTISVRTIYGLEYYYKRLKQ